MVMSAIKSFTCFSLRIHYLNTSNTEIDEPLNMKIIIFTMLVEHKMKYL